jgi:hypothetical protein
MDGAWHIQGVEERCILGFGGKNLMERNHLKDTGIDVSIILKCILKSVEEMAWMNATEGRENWQAVVNTVRGEFLG